MSAGEGRNLSLVRRRPLPALAGAHPAHPIVTPAGEPPASRDGARNRPRVIVSSLASDSHTWNLVYLQLLLEELGHEVTNLGACVPDDVLVATCTRQSPDLIVISSVNGHGFQEGERVIHALRAQPSLAATPIVIGGKLGTAGSDPCQSRTLIDAGYDAVFEDGAAGVVSFRSFVAALPAGAH
ncbi:cobalamin B12-binding domain-containing protein [Streptomyces sp. NPDC004296]|uniref:cobalamin B12-binding domain-containing protein n=1 Tax=Streptomyces sp. NPDC004296 TaxID=3364697 RepID=UPI0036821F00